MQERWRKYYDLRENFKTAISEREVKSIRQGIAIAIKMPFPSFYISAESCYVIICRMERDDSILNALNYETRRKYAELYKRFSKAYAVTNDRMEACLMVVRQQAPELYMSLNSAYNFYINMRKKEKLLNKLKHI